VSRPTLYNAGQPYLDKDKDWIRLLGSNETQTDPLPELSDLTLAVATINAWNRLAISSRDRSRRISPGQAVRCKKRAEITACFLLRVGFKQVSRILGSLV
jgi:hypothetical protein